MSLDYLHRVGAPRVKVVYVAGQRDGDQVVSAPQAS